MSNNVWLLTQEIHGLENHQETLTNLNETLKSSHLQIAIRDISEAIDSIQEVISEEVDAEDSNDSN